MHFVHFYTNWNLEDVYNVIEQSFSVMDKNKPFPRLGNCYYTSAFAHNSHCHWQIAGKPVTFVLLYRIVSSFDYLKAMGRKLVRPNVGPNHKWTGKVTGWTR